MTLLRTSGRALSRTAQHRGRHSRGCLTFPSPSASVTNGANSLSTSADTRGALTAVLDSLPCKASMTASATSVDTPSWASVVLAPRWGVHTTLGLGGERKRGTAGQHDARDVGVSGCHDSWLAKMTRTSAQTEGTTQVCSSRTIQCQCTVTNYLV